MFMLCCILCSSVLYGSDIILDHEVAQSYVTMRIRDDKETWEKEIRKVPWFLSQMIIFALVCSYNVSLHKRFSRMVRSICKGEIVKQIKNFDVAGFLSCGSFHIYI